MTDEEFDAICRRVDIRDDVWRAAAADDGLTQVQARRYVAALVLDAADVVRPGPESQAGQIYRDVLAIAADYTDPSRDIIASMPFGATLDQVMGEKYGVMLDRPEGTQS